MNHLDAAEDGAEARAQGAPENLAAIRGSRRFTTGRGRAACGALRSIVPRLTWRTTIPDLEQIVDEISQAITPAADASSYRRLAIPDALSRSRPNRRPCPSSKGFSAPFIPIASGGRFRILPCARLFAKRLRLATPNCGMLFGPLSLDGLVVTHLPNVFYLTNFLGTAGIAVFMGDRLYLILDFRYSAAAQELWQSPSGCPDAEIVPVERTLRRDAGGADQEAASEASGNRRYATSRFIGPISWRASSRRIGGRGQ